jgi:hypothetical protein
LKGNEVGAVYSGEVINACRILAGQPEGKTPLGRPISRWEDNINMDFRKTGLDIVDWIHLAQNRSAPGSCDTVMNPYKQDFSFQDD